MKRIWKVLACITLLCCINIHSVSAETSSFYFNLSTYSTDMTLRTIKDGGDAYEPYYYMTPTLIQYDKNFTVTPWRIITETNRVQVGSPATISFINEGITHKLSYFSAANVPANNYYYLIGRLSAVGDQYVEGRYCP